MVLPGCLKLGSSDKVKTAPETTMQKEVGELIKIYRLCLQKYEENPVKAKENCGVYKDAIRDIVPDTQKSLVTELMDRLRENLQMSKRN